MIYNITIIFNIINNLYIESTQYKTFSTSIPTTILIIMIITIQLVTITDFQSKFEPLKPLNGKEEVVL